MSDPTATSPTSPTSGSGPTSRADDDACPTCGRRAATWWLRVWWVAVTALAIYGWMVLTDRYLF